MILALSASASSIGLWLAGGIMTGLLTVVVALRFGVIGLMVMLAVIAAISAAILSTIH